MKHTIANYLVQLPRHEQAKEYRQLRKENRSDYALVFEPPGAEHLDSLRQERVWHPHVKVGGIGGDIRHWKRLDVGKGHRAVSVQPLVFRGDFPGSVFKLPGRVSQNRLESLPFADP